MNSSIARTPVTVRFGTVEEAAQLASLRWQSRSDEEREQESFAGFAARFTSWLREAVASKAWSVAVASNLGGLVGCMYLRQVDTVPVPGIPERAWGYVTHAFVLERHRNRGIGRTLLDLLVRDADARGLQELHVWPSQGAISLYVRAGFATPEMQRLAQPPDEPSYVLPLTGKLR